MLVFNTKSLTSTSLRALQAEVTEHASARLVVAQPWPSPFLCDQLPNLLRPCASCAVAMLASGANVRPRVYMKPAVYVHVPWNDASSGY